MLSSQMQQTVYLAPSKAWPGNKGSSLSLSLITAGEAVPATLSVALGPPLQQGQGNWQGYDIRAGELDLWGEAEAELVHPAKKVLSRVIWQQQKNYNMTVNHFLAAPIIEQRTTEISLGGSGWALQAVFTGRVAEH